MTARVTPKAARLPAALLLMLPLVALAANPVPAQAPAPAPGKDKGAPAASKDAPPDAQQPPRRSYNQARAAFASGDLAKAEAGFLAARDRAEGDDEVRFRAAFNLALTYAQKGAGLTKDKPQDALAALKQSAAWFRDAVRGRPKDADARHNLELVLRRIQQLADQLDKGQNSLEARLNRVIQDQRTLRDRVRGLLVRVNQAGAAAEPLAFQGEFDETSTFERTLLSDAGAVLDLAGDERDHLSQRAEKDRTPEDQGKLVQLQNLEHYLNLGRGTMADVARLLRRLQGDRAHQQADVAVTQLKRALEQLQDPVTVLKGLAADQTQALTQTRALDEIRSRAQQLSLDGDQNSKKSQEKTDAGRTAPTAPPWLTPAFLAAQQREIGPRTSELLARLKAGVEHEKNSPSPPPGQPGPNGPNGPNGQPPDPRQEAQRKRVFDAAAQAVPILQEGLRAMEQAGASLGEEKLAPAGRSQTAALSALLRALERFSGLRDLIELAYGEQEQLVALLSPEAQARLAKLPPAERGALVTGAVARNQDRLARLKGLLSDELQALAAPAPAQAQAQAGANPKEEADKRAAEKQRYEQAEQKRQQAEAAIGRLSTLVAKGGGPGPIRPTAEEGRKHLEELRRLFFTIVEHLKDLLRNQAETHDRTGSAQAQKDEAERQRRLGPLAEAEAGHAAMGKALAEALAAQADQAAQAGQAPQGGQTPQGGAPADPNAQKALAEAAEEVRKGHGAMASAAKLLRSGQDDAQSSSVDLEPPMEAQKKAMGHIEAAIKLLEPPQQDQQQQDKQNQQQQDEQISQDQAARRLQAIREREAERQRKKQPPSRPEPVEKDW